MSCSMKNQGNFRIVKKSDVKQIPLRIRKRYYDAIVSGEKTVEYRKESDYWWKMLGFGKNLKRVGVFICGKQVHRRIITRVKLNKTPSTFSEQGKKDVSTPYCFALILGDPVKVVNE